MGCRVSFAHLQIRCHKNKIILWCYGSIVKDENNYQHQVALNFRLHLLITVSMVVSWSPRKLSNLNSCSQHFCCHGYNIVMVYVYIMSPPQCTIKPLKPNTHHHITTCTMQGQSASPSGEMGRRTGQDHQIQYLHTNSCSVRQAGVCGCVQECLVRQMG